MKTQTIALAGVALVAAIGVSWLAAAGPSSSAVDINIWSQHAHLDFGLPGGCFEVQDNLLNPLFQVCNNDEESGFPQSHPVCEVDGTPECEDDDPGPDIRVRVDETAYSFYNIVLITLPVNHVLRVQGGGGPAQCHFTTAQCTQTFDFVPNTTPWFPWDVTGDGAVALGDFLGLLQHFGERKP